MLLGANSIGSPAAFRLPSSLAYPFASELTRFSRKRPGGDLLAQAC